MTFVGASAMINGKTKGVYPAAKALLSAVYEGALVDFDTALRIEARWFTHVLMNPSSSAMIRSLFVNKQALEKGANRPDVPDQKVSKGRHHRRGHDGRGHRLCLGQCRHRGRADRRGHRKPRTRVRPIPKGLLDKGMKRGKVTEEKESAGAFPRITATTDYAAL